MQRRAEAILVSTGLRFTTFPVELATLAAHYAMLAIHALREFAEAAD